MEHLRVPPSTGCGSKLQIGQFLSWIIPFGAINILTYVDKPRCSMQQTWWLCLSLIPHWPDSVVLTNPFASACAFSIAQASKQFNNETYHIWHGHMSGLTSGSKSRYGLDMFGHTQTWKPSSGGRLFHLVALRALSYLKKWNSWICTADFGQQLHIWQNELEILEARLQFTSNPFLCLPGHINAPCSQTKAFFPDQSRAYQSDYILLVCKF